MGFPGYSGIALGGNEVSTEIKNEVMRLREQLRQWGFEYYNWSAPTVTDEEYDQASARLAELERLHPELADPNSPTMRVGAPVVTGLDKVVHSAPMLSLEKAKTAKQVVAFFPVSYPGVVEPKIDGASLAVRYVQGRLVQAITRGDGREGEDVTHNARTIRTLPLVLKAKLSIEVRGEVFMRFTDFNRMNERLRAEGEEPAANPRNSASGALQLKDPRECAKVPLSFMAHRLVGRVEGYDTHDAALDLLEEQGFVTVSALPLPLKDCLTMFQRDVNLASEADLIDIIKHLEPSRLCQDFPTDGLVFKINNLAAQDEIGEGASSPRWAVAFKYPSEQVVTKITDIEFTVGKTGKITPVGLLKPVQVSGSTVARASLCNRDELKRLGGIGIGDIVLVEKSNEIIPKVIKVVKKCSPASILMPDVCPACGTILVEYPATVDIFCPNAACPAQRGARLVYALSNHALDLKGCGPQTVTLLVENGICSLADLFEAEAEDFHFLKSAARKNLVDGLDRAKKAAFWRKLTALCVEGWGEQICQATAAKFPDIEKLLAARDQNLLEGMEGVGAAKAGAMSGYLDANAEDIARLWQVGFLEPTTEESQATNVAVAGKSFCITGSLPGCTSRHLAEEEIRKQGGIVKSSVTRRLDYAVVGDDGGATKAASIARWHVKSLSPAELYRMLNWFPTSSAPDPNKEY